MGRASFLSTIMAATSCKWKCCEEETEGDHVLLVNFSNGNVRNANELDFTFYKDVNESNPRKKSRRILVAETDRLSYVGNNFSTGSLKCNSLCKYYVGVLDKKTKQMEVHNAQLFSLQPVVPGESTAKDETDAHDTKSYRQKVDSLIEAFGTNKQKRALSSRRLNQVGSESLQQAVAQAASNIIQQKGIEVLQQEVADSKAQAEAALYLPPCNPEAEKEADVYPFNQLLSDIEFDALESVGRKMSELSKDELLSMKEKGSPQLVVRHLEFLPSDTPSRDRMSRCVWYLSLLINLAHEKKVNRKFGSKDDCPRIIQNKVMKAFTVESFNNGRVMNMVSSSMKVKLASYCLALLLHMNSMTANLTLLHQDLGLPETRILEVAKAMGLRLNKVVTDVIGRGDQHRLACLELPLAKYDHPGQRNKRRKLH